VRIIPFPRRSPQSFPDNTSGLFFCLPRGQQEARIRQLARSRLTPEQITTVCRMPLSVVMAILEARP
jgi:hypothetical protein